MGLERRKEQGKEDLIRTYSSNIPQFGFFLLCSLASRGIKESEKPQFGHLKFLNRKKIKKKKSKL